MDGPGYTRCVRPKKQQYKVYCKSHQNLIPPKKNTARRARGCHARALLVGGMADEAREQRELCTLEKKHPWSVYKQQISEDGT